MVRQFIITCLIAGTTLVNGHPFASTNDIGVIDATVSICTPETKYVEMVDSQGFTWALEDCPLEVKPGEEFQIVYLEPDFTPVEIESKEGDKKWAF